MQLGTVWQPRTTVIRSTHYALYKPYCCPSPTVLCYHCSSALSSQPHPSSLSIRPLLLQLPSPVTNGGISFTVHRADIAVYSTAAVVLNSVNDRSVHTHVVTTHYPPLQHQQLTSRLCNVARCTGCRWDSWTVPLVSLSLVACSLWKHMSWRWRRSHQALTAHVHNRPPSTSVTGKPFCIQQSPESNYNIVISF